MKFLVIVLCVLNLSVFAEVKNQTVQVTVSGLVCPLCFSKVEEKFKGNKKVKNIKIDMDKKLILVDYSSENPVTDEDIKNIISRDSGYTVIKIERI